MPTIDVGDKAAKALNLLTVAVNTVNTDSVVVKNVAGDTLNLYKSTQDASPTTLTPTNSATFTVPVFIQSQGRTSVQLTGGEYGNV